jgi:2-haloacid dehalogenase
MATPGGETRARWQAGAMTGTTHPRLVILDVNETLSDMRPMTDALDQVGAPPGSAAAWFASTLRDGFALTAAGGSPAFLEVATDALRAVLGHVDDAEKQEEAVESVMAAFRALPVHDDVPHALRDLKAAGIRLVTLSNGAANVAQGLLERAGISDLVEATLSVEDAGAWKPDHRAYDYALQQTGVAGDQAMLVAAHPWDVDGAARAGLRTAWVNRAGVAYPRSFRPADVVVPTLADLPMALTAG